MTQKKLTVFVEPGAKGNEHWYVARSEGEVVAKVRIPSHYAYIEDEERKAFLFREVAAALAGKLHKLGYRGESE